IELAADSTCFLGRPHLRRVIWRLTPDQQGAVTQLITGDADAVEVLVTPDNVQRARADTALATYPYRGSAYGYVGFNLAAPGDSTKPHPLFGDRDLRRALVMATDRERVLRNVFGDLAKVPPGPLSQVWWIWDPEIRALPYDSGPAPAASTRCSTCGTRTRRPRRAFPRRGRRRGSGAPTTAGTTTRRWTGWWTRRWRRPRTATRPAAPGGRPSRP